MKQKTMNPSVSETSELFLLVALQQDANKFQTNSINKLLLILKAGQMKVEMLSLLLSKLALELHYLDLSQFLLKKPMTHSNPTLV